MQSWLAQNQSVDQAEHKPEKICLPLPTYAEI